MTAVDILLKHINNAQTEFRKNYPPPYNYPSDTGRTAQLISDTINAATIIKNKIKDTLDEKDY
jgi:hypothetical protein